MSVATTRTMVVAAALCVVVGIAGWLALHDDRTPPSSSAPRTPQSSATIDAPTPAPSRAGSWRRVTLRYAGALTDTSGGLDGWLGRLRPWVSPALLASYRGTDVDELPDGSPRTVRRAPGPAQDSATSQTARVTYDSGYVLDVRLAKVDGSWKVTSSGEHLRPDRRS